MLVLLAMCTSAERTMTSVNGVTDCDVPRPLAAAATTLQRCYAEDCKLVEKEISLQFFHYAASTESADTGWPWFVCQSTHVSVNSFGLFQHLCSKTLALHRNAAKLQL